MTSTTSTNITWQTGHVDRIRREKLLRQKGCIVWLTGLPSSGKSSTAFTLEHLLVSRGCPCYVLDGDNVRHGLNRNLGFSAADRAENIRRIGEVAALFADAGLITMTSFISPYREDRRNARRIAEAAGLTFLEVFVDTPLEVCEQRDPKGLYRKARQGELKGFTGIDDPYESPEEPDLILDTIRFKPEDNAMQILEMLVARGIILRRDQA